MSRIRVGRLSPAILVLTWVGGCWSQGLQSQAITDQSLGDAAREQRQLHSSTKSEKAYSNEDVEPAGSGARWKSREASSTKPSSPVSQPSTPRTETRPETPGVEQGKPQRLPRRSVLDHRTDAEELDAEDSLTVPEGTELKIEIPAVTDLTVLFYAGRLVAPVRIGFATVIPAMSGATVQVVTRHYPWYGALSTLGYFEALEVSQVVVEGVAYTVQTDQVARPWRDPSPSELTFQLLKPLTIER